MAVAAAEGGGDSGVPFEPPPGGGGSLPQNVAFDALPKTAISEKLQCALDQYTQPSARPKHPIQHAGGYAYSYTNASGVTTRQYYSTWMDPSRLGPDWKVVGGLTILSTGASYIFDYAYNPQVFDRGVPWAIPNGEMGQPLGNGTLDLRDLTDFEVLLFTAAHEVAHQNGSSILTKEHFEEAWASWYGYRAVLNYRKDDGKKCGK